MSELGANIYWAYNLPLQVWPTYQDPDDEASPVVGTEILNYMPRKERCERIELDLEGMTREEFFERAAQTLENLARLMRKAGRDPSKCVYYPNNGMPEVDEKL